ncbi:ComF family protein [Acidovorax sp. Leaf160]|uniref:ComF family protein n=1 Tax=Acidovorax sp. Leaf160 TaxID=1736280 RepID=UPI0006F718C1|nr:ComF family protein [Acidovorax sp. Leaf160]KQR60797.1 hypothetical protein ASF94_17465 [Acidovorax sp. Leaf160]
MPPSLPQGICQARAGWRQALAWLALQARRIPAVPSQCAVCHAWPAERLCGDCVARFALPRHRCRNCALPLPPEAVQCGRCIRHSPPLDACLAAVDYSYPWAGLLAQFKFQHDPGWAAPLAARLRSAPGVEQALQAADWLLPVPLSAERLRERGFNQALLLARQLDRARTRSDWLLRLRATEAQSSLTRAQRLRNLRGAFALDPMAAAQLAGRRVVLLDDVMTTGATLQTAALVLRQAGVAHITGLVLARTA